MEQKYEGWKGKRRRDGARRQRENERVQGTGSRKAKRSSIMMGCGWPSRQLLKDQGVNLGQEDEWSQGIGPCQEARSSVLKLEGRADGRVRR